MKGQLDGKRCPVAELFFTGPWRLGLHSGRPLFNWRHWRGYYTSFGLKFLIGKMNGWGLFSPSKINQRNLKFIHFLPTIFHLHLTYFLPPITSSLWSLLIMEGYNSSLSLNCSSVFSVPLPPCPSVPSTLLIATLWPAQSSTPKNWSGREGKKLSFTNWTYSKFMVFFTRRFSILLRSSPNHF